jgi:hypothetical protein
MRDLYAKHLGGSFRVVISLGVITPTFAEETRDMSRSQYRSWNSNLKPPDYKSVLSERSYISITPYCICSSKETDALNSLELNRPAFVTDLKYPRTCNGRL